MNYLTRILDKKRLEVAQLISQIDIDELKAAAYRVRRQSRAHALKSVLDNKQHLNIIAEFKRASPSKGPIGPNADPVQQAKNYEAGGARAISVLTDEEYFCGSLKDLEAVRKTVDLPVLRKDFIMDPIQVYETAVAGADALLIIANVLSEEQLSDLRFLAEDVLGMDALVEVHSAEEMKRAIDCGATLVGVNNRNLNDFSISLSTSFRLAELAPPHIVLVSESGLTQMSELNELRARGYSAFLIGETLMKANDARTALAQLIRGLTVA